MRFGLLLCVCAVLSVFESATARADAADLTPEGPRRLALGGDVGYYVGDQAASTVHVIAPRIAAQYAFDERFSIAADFGVVVLHQDPDGGPGSETVVRPGNPVVMGLLRNELGPLRYRVGLGGAAPLAVVERDGEGRLQRAAYGFARALTGLWDVWVWGPSRGAVFGYFKLEYIPHPDVNLELELAPALLIPAREAYGRDPVDFYLPTAIVLMAHKGLLNAGLRVQAVFMPTVEPDMMQLTLEPIVRLVFGTTFVEARYTAPIDEPLAGERGPRVWALHLAFGASI